MTPKQLSIHARYALAATCLSVLLAAPAARALEEQKGEAQAIADCDKRLCGILLQKNRSGDDLKCALTKTWARSTLKGGDQANLVWGFGDARCSIEIKVPRASLVAAVTTGGKYKFWMPPHTATCVVEENGQPKSLKATVEPKIEFNDGKAEKIWINLRHIEGAASIKDWLSLAASLTDSTGIFHAPMIKAVNRYIYRDCPKKHPQAQAAAPPPKPKTK